MLPIKFLTTISVYFVSFVEKSFWVMQISTTNYDYPFYEFQVWKVVDPNDDCNENNTTAIWTGIAVDEKPGDVAKIENPSILGSRPILPGVFCVKVTPGLCSECGSVATKIYPKVQKQDSPRIIECNSKTYTLIMQPDNNRMTLRGVFLAKPKECIAKVKYPYFTFWKLKPGSNATNCRRRRASDFTEEPLLNTIPVKSDSNLSTEVSVTPGNFCIAFSYNLKKPRGFDLFDVVTDILQVGHINLAADPVFGDPSAGDGTLLYVLIPVFMIYLLAVGLVVRVCRNQRIKRHGFSLLSKNKDVTLNKVMEKAEELTKSLELIVFYFRDFDEHKWVVESLCNFFSNAWKVGSVHYDCLDEADIDFSESSWVEKMTENKANRHIVIVESELAVLQDIAKQEHKIIRPAQEDWLDNISPYALDLLKCNSRSINDYRNISVVKFEYSPKDLVLRSFVPHRRYELHRDLFLMYRNILDLPSMAVDVLDDFEREMNNRWSDDLDKKLKPAIKLAADKIKKNPSLVQSSLQEIPLYHTSLQKEEDETI